MVVRLPLCTAYPRGCSRSLRLQVMEERRDILAKLQMVNIPDRMMALQSVISETLKVGLGEGCLRAA